jgi:hypothetical protein
LHVSLSAIYSLYRQYVCCVSLSGGAIFATLSELTLLNSTFANNHASHVGGVVYAPDNQLLNVSHCTFSANSADVDAGVLAVLGGAVLIEDTAFERNFASHRGGSIVLSEAAAALTRVSIRHSHTLGSSALMGGSLYASSSTLRIEAMDCRNSTGSEGYFLYLTKCQTTVLRSRFSGGTGADGIAVTTKTSLFRMLSSSIEQSR